MRGFHNIHICTHTHTHTVSADFHSLTTAEGPFPVGSREKKNRFPRPFPRRLAATQFASAVRPLRRV